jgi:hypothetical protein
MLLKYGYILNFLLNYSVTRWNIHEHSTCRERQSECAKRRVLLYRNSFSYSFL